MKKRLYVISILFLIYITVILIDFSVERIVFHNTPHNGTQSNTKSHFRQPIESPVSLEYFEIFIGRVAAKYGIGISPYLYISIFALFLIYLILSVIILTKLFTTTRQ